MSAAEMMIRNILKAADIDIEMLKGEVTTRIKTFEQNVDTLNATLIAHHKSLASLETKLNLILAHLGIEVPPTANTTENANGTGSSVSKIAG